VRSCELTASVTWRIVASDLNRYVHAEVGRIVRHPEVKWVGVFFTRHAHTDARVSARKNAVFDYCAVGNDHERISSRNNQVIFRCTTSGSNKDVVVQLGDGVGHRLGPVGKRDSDVQTRTESRRREVMELPQGHCIAR